MIGKTDIQKMAKHIFRRSQNISDRHLIHPKREWGIGIVIFIVILSSGAYFSATNFSYYKDIEKKLPSQELNLVRYQSGTLKIILEKYQLRQEQASQVLESAQLFPLELVTVTDEITSSSTEASKEVPTQ
jgi:hypothetical protein